MHYFDQTNIKSLSVHRVGNHQRKELLTLSKAPIQLTEELQDLLHLYFLQPFDREEYFEFVHDSNLDLHEVYTYVSQIFENQESLHDQSIQLATHLYKRSTHPNIKQGEFYTVYFENVILEGEMMDAVGLFKSENKDTYLQVESKDHEFSIESEEGINIKKLDKGCLIFNTEKENGYRVAIVDKTNRQYEAQYWIDDFLQVKQREDNYFNTENTLTMYKNFVTKNLSNELALNKADQADMLNRTMGYFKENDEFQLQDFQEKVLQKKEVIESFTDYKNNYEEERQFQFAEEFPISSTAVNRQNRSFKSVIKLDKNFHIYVHGDRSKIEQGEDNRGKFYKVYFDEER